MKEIGYGTDHGYHRQGEGYNSDVDEVFFGCVVTCHIVCLIRNIIQELSFVKR